MRRVPHVLAVVGAIMLVWWAALILQAGATISARQYSISWSHYFAALGLWILAGLFLALPSVTTALVMGRKLAVHWPTLILYVVPGLVLALLLPLWQLIGMWGLTWVPTDWMSPMHRYGGEMLGCLLVGYGLIQSLTGGSRASTGA